MSDTHQGLVRKSAIRMGENADGGAADIRRCKQSVPPSRQFVKQLEYENQTQAAAGNVSTVAICIGCVLLILSGIWKGFHGKPDLSS